MLFRNKLYFNNLTTRICPVFKISISELFGTIQWHIWHFSQSYILHLSITHWIKFSQIHNTVDQIHGKFKTLGVKFSHVQNAVDQILSNSKRRASNSVEQISRCAEHHWIFCNSFWVSKWFSQILQHRDNANICDTFYCSTSAANILSRARDQSLISIHMSQSYKKIL